MRFFRSLFFVALLWSPAQAQTLSVASQTEALCAGDCSGFFTLAATGGQAPYQYSNNGGSTWQSSNTFSGLCSGTYTFTAMDANNVQFTVTDSIIAALPITYSLASTNCTAWNLCNGTISVHIVSGGVPPYTYIVASASGTQTYTSSPITGLCAGTYTVTVVDTVQCPGGGCTGTPIVTITAPAPPPPPLTMVLTPGPRVCPYTCQTASIAASGGTPPYQYSFSSASGPWSSSSTSSCLTGSSVTGYVKDATGQIISATVATNWPPPFVAGFTTMSPQHCGYFQPCDGVFIISPSGGVPPYTGGSTGSGSTVVFQNQCSPGGPFMISDAAGCIISVSGSVGYMPLSIMATTTAACNCNGTISVTTNFPAQSPAYYQYSLNNFSTVQTSPAFTGLCAGTYTVSARAMTSAGPQCVATTTVTVANNTPALNVTNTSPTCNGGCNGTISASASPTGTYQYKLNAGNWQSSGNYAGLCAGTYTVSTQNSSGCITTTTVTITQPPPITVVATPISPACFGYCNGGMYISPGTGSPPGTYQYGLMPLIPPQNNSIIKGLCAGTYTAIVYNPTTGCSGSAAVTITQPPQITITASVTPVACSSPCSGSITASAAPAGTYQYKLNNGSYQSSPTFSGLCAGTYTITAMNSTNCTNTNTFTITGSTPTITATTSAPSCSSVCNGGITATASPSGTWQYSIDGGINWSSSSTFSNLCAGTYTVDAQNSSTGCATSSTYTITAPTPAVTASTSSASCNAACDGSFTATASPAGTWQYSINGGTNWQSSSTFSNLCAGGYTVLTQNAAGCTANAAITITEPPAITVTATTTLPCYSQCTGSITLSASPAGTYQYSINSTTVFQSSPVFASLCAGTYILRAKNGNGCIATTTVMLTQQAQITYTPTSTSPQCNGSCNGNITINAVSPSGTYQYSSNNGSSWQSSNAFTNLCAGNYTIVVQDAGGCTASSPVTLTTPSVIASTTATSASACGTTCTGTISASTTPTGTYQYSIDNGNTWQSSTTFNSLCPGSYALLTQDANGCIVSVPANVAQATAASIAATSSSLTCFGDCNGSLVASVSPAGTYQYTIDNNTWQSSNTFTNLCAGTYLVHATDGNGCHAYSNVTITQPPQVQATASITTPSCNGICDGSITASASPAGTYQYSFNLGQSWQSSDSIGGICDGGFNIIAMNAAGCSDTVWNVYVLQPPAIAYTFATTDASCAGQCNGSIVFNPTIGNTTPYQYSINNGQSWQSGTSFSNLCAGGYAMQMRDANGCIVGDSVLLHEPLPLASSIFTTGTSCGECNGSAAVTASGGTGPYQYNWINFSGPTPGIDLCSGNYFVELIDSAGCRDTVALNIAASTGATIDSVSAVGTPSQQPWGTATVYASGTSPITYQWDAAAGSQTTSTATALFPGNYCVTILDGAGCVDTACVTVPVMTEISTHDLSTIRVYPNPFDQQLVISGNGEATIRLTDVLGQTIASFSKIQLTVSGTSLELPDLAAGVYFLSVDVANQQVAFRIVKQ